MSKKTIAVILLLSVFLFSSGLQFVKIAKPNFFPIPIPQPAYVINADGSVQPTSAPIQRDGNIYTFIESISGHTIAVERDNVILDGGGYVLQGNGNSTGIFIKNHNSVTVRNMKIRDFTYGIRLFAEDFMSTISSDNNLMNNQVEDCTYGIYISYSCNNTLRNNKMNNNQNNFYIKGGFLSENQKGYMNDVDSSNTVDEKPIIYWVNQQDKIVPANAGTIALVNCKNITVQKQEINKNFHGILLVSTTNSRILNNHISNSGNGIYLFNSTNNLINNNILTNSSNGIQFQTSSDNEVSTNNLTDNENGIYFFGASNNNILHLNYIIGSTADGIHFHGPSNTTIKENILLKNNETGINLFDSRNNKIVNNRIKDTNGYAIRLWYFSNENTISDNNLSTNGGGILIEDTVDNKIIKNVITENNGWGIRLEGKQNNNVIYLNSFISNKIEEGLQVSIPGVWPIDGDGLAGGNVWDNGTTGNYWSDYFTRYPNATEIDNTGIGDTPFYINENNIDRYPITKTVEIPEFNSLAPVILASTFIALILFYKRRLNKPKEDTLKNE